MRIGIDVGGTKIEAIALDGGGTELKRLRVKSPRGDYEGTIRAIVGLVAKIEKSLGERGSVGMGIPGTIFSHATVYLADRG